MILGTSTGPVLTRWALQNSSRGGVTKLGCDGNSRGCIRDPEGQKRGDFQWSCIVKEWQTGVDAKLPEASVIWLLSWLHRFSGKKSQRWLRYMGNQEKGRLSDLCVVTNQGRNVRNRKEISSPTSLILFLLPCSLHGVTARSHIRILRPGLSMCHGEDSGAKLSSVLVEQSEWSVENCNNLSSVNNLLFKRIDFIQ